MARSRGQAAGRDHLDRTDWRRYATARVVDVLFQSAMLGMAALSVAIVVCGFVLSDDSWLPRLISIGALLAVLGLGLLAAQWLILSDYRWTVRVTVNRPWYGFVGWIAVLLFAWAFGTWGAAHGIVRGTWSLVPATIAAVGTVIAALASWRGAKYTVQAGRVGRAAPSVSPVVSGTVSDLATALHERPTRGADVLFRTPATEELENLATLLDDGLISWHEFRDLKVSLLQRERLARLAEDNLWAEFEEYLRGRAQPPN